MLINKENLKQLAFAALIFNQIACTEIAPVIPALGDSKVFVEEFTGVQCVNCPAGASDIADLKGIYGDRLVVVSIHAGDFAPPFSDSKFDFRTPEGNELEKLLGAPAGYPSAVINRKRFSGRDGLQLFRTSWAGSVASETTNPSVLNLGLVKKYDKTTREFALDVRILPNENRSGDFRISIFLTEDNIKDKQETPQGKKADYVHKFVLRKMLSKTTGDPLSIFVQNQAQNARFTYKIPQNWVAENCRIVALVHEGSPNRTAFQVSEIKIVD